MRTQAVEHRKRVVEANDDQLDPADSHACEDTVGQLSHDGDRLVVVGLQPRESKPFDGGRSLALGRTARSR